MQATRSDQRLEEKFGEVGEAVRVNANLSDHLAEIFSIIFEDPQQSSWYHGKVIRAFALNLSILSVWGMRLPPS